MRPRVGSSSIQATRGARNPRPTSTSYADSSPDAAKVGNREFPIPLAADECGDVANDAIDPVTSSIVMSIVTMRPLWARALVDQRHTTVTQAATNAIGTNRPRPCYASRTAGAPGRTITDRLPASIPRTSTMRA
jgi:hypothetical protein